MKTATISRTDLPERRCKRCGRLLEKRMALIDGRPAETSGSGVRVEILTDIWCPKCGYKNFFHDRY